MPGESLRFPIFAPDHASGNIREVGDAAAKTAAKLDIAAASAKLWNDTTIKSGKAADTALASMKAHAAATALLADAENVLAGKATTTTKLMADQGRTLESTGKAAEKAAGTAGSSGIGALIGGGGLQGGGMAALIATGAALSPVIATLGTGLAGFGAAAYGVAKPIADAAGKTGGLAANMAKLNPEQQKVAQGLLGLGTEFAAFQKQMQPEVFTVFNEGIRLAGHLLHDVQPVAKATGIALGGMLGQIDAEFQSGQWQQFFGFMARTAGPDVALLTKTFINLMGTLPPLLQLLQPVATDVLGIAAGFSKLVEISAQAGQGIDKTGQHMNFLEKITAGLRTVLFAPGVGLLDALKVLGVVSSGPASKGLAAVAGVTVSAQAKLLALNKTADALSATWAGTPAKAAPATDAIIRMVGAAQFAFLKAGSATDQITRLGTSAQIGAGRVKPLTDQITMTAHANEAASRSAGPLTDEISRLVIPAKAAAVRLADVAKAVTAINTAESTALATASAYAGDLVTTADDAAALRKALRASHDEIGLHTAIQRASFGAANTYITDLGNTAAQAYKSGHGVDASIKAIRTGLPILDQAKTKNRAYWQEVQTLVGWLNKLRLEKAIHESVFVSGSGTFTVKAGTKLGLPGGTAGGPFAAGGLVRAGAGPTADNVLARVSKGELIIPAKMVSAGLVDHLRGALPGFAAGGLVPSYSGNVAGLVPWSRHDLNAAVAIFEQATAKATFAAMKAAAAAARAAAAGAGRAGPGGGAPGANAALARSMMPAWGSGAEWAAWNYVAMRECLPVRTRILTKRGWLTHDEVQVGDETIGYNLETGRSEWTRVTRVVHYEQAEVWRFGDAFWSVECTPEHRWLMEQIHRPVVERGSQRRRTVIGSPVMVQLKDRQVSHRVILACEADTGPGLPISLNEAALLGWIAGDGWEEKPKPTRGRHPNGYKSGSRSMTYHIGQTKEVNWDAIDEAIGVHGRVTRTRERLVKGELRRDREWRLSAPYAHDLTGRAGNPRTDAVAQVLAMSAEQREAWLGAIVAAEGHRGPNYTQVSQSEGPVADAIVLAVYLSGHTASIYKHDRRSESQRHKQVSLTIGITRSRLGDSGHRGAFTKPAGHADVWCVTTELGSWTAEQDRQVFLTGNSGWNQFARNPSSGAYGIPQALPASKMGAAANPPQSNPHAQISWMIGYIRGRYGDPIGAAAHERAFNWYGKGLQGGIFTQPTLIGVGERGPERVDITPAGSRGGGVTINNLTITLPPGSDREQGRRIVSYIRSFEQGSGAGWRS